MFKDLRHEKFGKLNLNAEAIKFLKEHPSYARGGKNPFLDPATCQEIIQSIHTAHGWKGSYGGYMEVRSTLWKGSYLDESKSYLHLGVDVYMPEGTPVCADFNGVVLYCGFDEDQNGGWGWRVVLVPDGPLDQDFAYLYAHLAPGKKLKRGTRLYKGQVLGRIGDSSVNGGWFPHLHVQAVDREVFKKLRERDELYKIDGYAKPSESQIAKKLFPNPLKYIRIP